MVPDHGQCRETGAFVGGSRGSMTRITAGLDDGNAASRSSDVLDGLRHQGIRDPLPLMARIHADNLDLAPAQLPINDDSDETGGVFVDVRHPDPGLIPQADPAHELRMRNGPVRPYPKKDGTPKHLFDRRENRAPCIHRECNDLFHIRGEQRTYHRIHGLSMAGVGAVNRLSASCDVPQAERLGRPSRIPTGPLITPEGLGLRHERRSPAIRTTIPPGKGQGARVAPSDGLASLAHVPAPSPSGAPRSVPHQNGCRPSAVRFGERCPSRRRTSNSTSNSRVNRDARACVQKP
ncbi:hypothetical protein Ga0074812_12218 [Parafrankia irregularis]|uniref:Uncharacterized protein n=1 Tax=Parafrankia irregularis TaxID=795642 RepID=A0A0S4QT23_9ACTN|nr:hypothetical protein Ga0074812_12218 [Parafrankia irregularis]